jgi:hypothetical protein
VKRERATELAGHLLRNLDAGQNDWPLSLLTEVYVFGSFARGALSTRSMSDGLRTSRPHFRRVVIVFPHAPGVPYPRCTGGRGETPGEDSGGIWAFNEERAQGGIPDSSFDPADVTQGLADLTVVIAPAT